MNWAMVVTFARIALIPVFVIFMFQGSDDPGGTATHVGSWMALAVFAIAAVSDTVDGYLARRHERVTKLGQFLDPLADKLLVGAALIALVALRDFPVWAAVVIVVRELSVSLLRVAAARKGRSLPASLLGKIKTSFQIPTVMLWLLPREGTLAAAQDIAVVVAVVLTVISGLVYFARAGELLRPAEKRPAGSARGG